MENNKFSSIESFRKIVTRVKLHKNTDCEKANKLPIITFIGTTKVHGSNLAIRRYNSKILTYSRSREITPTDDHLNFAAWVDNIISKQPTDNPFVSMANTLSNSMDDDVHLYGEYIGPNIHKGMAINQLTTNHWVLFAAKVNGEYVELPSNLEAANYNIYNIKRTKIFEITIDFNNLAQAEEELEKLTLAAEKNCPYAALFGIAGIGEGIVWQQKDNLCNSRMWFKTKGEAHVNIKKKSKKIASSAPEIVNEIKALLPELIPIWRLDQGLSYLQEEGIEITKKNIGKYLEWILRDIIKEESDIITANEHLEWKEISKFVSIEAKKYYFDKIKV